jgi:hypothetical protein
MTTKRCRACGKTKAAAEFGANRAKADGLNITCKLCRAAAARGRRRAGMAVAAEPPQQPLDKNLVTKRRARTTKPAAPAQHDRRHDRDKRCPRGCCPPASPSMTDWDDQSWRGSS